MDLVSDICSGLRLRSELYFTAIVDGNWALRVPQEKMITRFHLILNGGCFLSLGSGDWKELHEGDWVLIPHGRQQLLSSEPNDANVLELSDLVPEKVDKNKNLRLHEGDEKDAVKILCGYCSFEEHVPHPMFESLPEFVCIEKAILGDFPWLADALHALTRDLEQASGLSAVTSRLVEILFIQSLRYLEETNASGFFRATRDPRINKSLSAIHAKPNYPWTLSKLSSIAAMSRTTYAEQFKQTVNRTPNQYLTEWRLSKACQLLSSTGLSVAEIADKVGYQSVPSLTRRFSKTFGVGPGEYRKQHA